MSWRVKDLRSCKNPMIGHGLEELHIYLDEKYADPGTSHDLQVTSLTGVLLTSSQLVPFRHMYFGLLNDLFPSRPKRLPNFIEVHASNLFPDEPNDEVRYEFMQNLVSIVNEMQLPVMRIGYRRNSDAQKLYESAGLWRNYQEFEKKALLSLCFSGFKSALDSSEALVFYHMETDNSDLQYHTFQRSTTNTQWVGKFLFPESMSIDPDKTGDVSFYAKGSPYGVLPDCMGYLLHLRWRRGQGACLRPYGRRMTEIFDDIDEELIREQVVDIQSS